MSAESSPAGPAVGGHEDRSFPPIAVIAVAAMALVIVGGIYLASNLPHPAQTGPAVGVAAAAGVLIAIDVALLSRIRDFAWPVFFRVAGWALLAYAVISGMLEFIFVFDHTRGSMLVLMTVFLVIFAVDIPMLLGFSVARFQDVEPVG